MDCGSIKLHFISLEQIQKRNRLVTIKLAKGPSSVKTENPRTWQKFCQGRNIFQTTLRAQIYVLLIFVNNANYMVMLYTYPTSIFPTVSTPFDA